MDKGKKKYGLMELGSKEVLQVGGGSSSLTVYQPDSRIVTILDPNRGPDPIDGNPEPPKLPPVTGN